MRLKALILISIKANFSHCVGRQAVVKSTLLNILSGIDKPTSGTVIFFK